MIDCGERYAPKNCACMIHSEQICIYDIYVYNIAMCIYIMQNKNIYYVYIYIFIFVNENVHMYVTVCIYTDENNMKYMLTYMHM